MAEAKRRRGAPRQGRDPWKAWRGEAGRCGECQTRRRPVSQYAVTADKDRWFCDRCMVDQHLAGCLYLPWARREELRANPGAAYSCPPEEPAPRGRPVAGEDRVAAALAALGPVGWEDEDDEDDRQLRLSELRRVGLAVADLFQDGTTPADARPGLLRAMEMLQARMRELGG